MGTEEIRISDISGQRIEKPDEQLVSVVVAYHPRVEPGTKLQLDALPAEVKDLSKLSIAAVGLEVTFPGDEAPTRHVLTEANFDKLAPAGRTMEEILASAAVVAAVKQRRSHNTTKDGGALINYNDPDYAGLPHKGKIGEQEAAFVRENLDLVNQRRSAAGHPVIDPSNPLDAKRYGLDKPES
jgi:hypothetical protein